METKWSVVLVALMLAVAAVAPGRDEEGQGDPADAGEQDLESPLITMDNVVLFQDVSGAFDVEVTATDDVGIETVELLARESEGAVEVGPGAVLAGLAKRIAREWPVRTTSDAEGVRKLLAA